MAVGEAGAATARDAKEATTKEVEKRILKSLFILELTRLKKEKMKVGRGSTTTCSLALGNRVPDYWYTD